MTIKPHFAVLTGSSELLQVDGRLFHTTSEPQAGLVARRYCADGRGEGSPRQALVCRLEPLYGFETDERNTSGGFASIELARDGGPAGGPTLGAGAGPLPDGSPTADAGGELGVPTAGEPIVQEIPPGNDEPRREPPTGDQGVWHGDGVEPGGAAGG